MTLWVHCDGAFPPHRWNYTCTVGGHHWNHAFNIHQRLCVLHNKRLGQVNPHLSPQNLQPNIIRPITLCVQLSAEFLNNEFLDINGLIYACGYIQ